MGPKLYRYHVLVMCNLSHISCIVASNKQDECASFLHSHVMDRSSILD